MSRTKAASRSRAFTNRGLAGLGLLDRTLVERAARAVAAEAGFRYHALVPGVEIARQVVALGTLEAPGIIIR